MLKQPAMIVSIVLVVSATITSIILDITRWYKKRG